jgi:hypothetical protein
MNGLFRRRGAPLSGSIGLPWTPSSSTFGGHAQNRPIIISRKAGRTKSKAASDCAGSGDCPPLVQTAEVSCQSKPAALFQALRRRRTVFEAKGTLRALGPYSTFELCDRVTVPLCGRVGVCGGVQSSFLRVSRNPICMRPPPHPDGPALSQTPARRGVPQRHVRRPSPGLFALPSPALQFKTGLLHCLLPSSAN